MSRKTILVVDDEPNVRLMFRTTLETVGHDVIEAGDGAAALDILAAADRPIDLVLLDLRMPAIDGMETLRRMRAGNLAHPVIIITAHGSVPDAVEAMRLGAIDFLAKPVTPEALRNAAREVLGRQDEDEQDPRSDVIRLAKLAINRREFDRLGPLLDRAFALEIATAEAHYLRGLLLELRGQADAARRAYQASLAEDANYEDARLRLTLLPDAQVAP